MALKIGNKAPDFSLPDQDGQTHKLSDYRGQFVLLYFYPKDDTPGCTMEACGMRDQFKQFGKLDAVVFGISADTVEKHKKFADKYKLPFSLLADVEKKVVNKYEVWGPKKFMGKTFDGIHRKSFLIDTEGVLCKIYEKVKPAEHAEEVLRDIKELTS